MSPAAQDTLLVATMFFVALGADEAIEHVARVVEWLLS